MTKGPMAGPMLRLAVPLALTGMLQQFLNTTDTFVVGRFVSTEALAALGNNGPLVGLLVSLFMGLSLGANVVIAKALGGRRIADASSAIHTSFFLAVFWGLGIAAAGESRCLVGASVAGRSGSGFSGSGAVPADLSSGTPGHCTL